MRGKRERANEQTQKGRITPACAGKTEKKLEAEELNRDHPRVCGENQAWILLEDLRRGSPPRVRGKLVKAGVSRVELRITPACAGKTEMLYNAKDIC